MMIIGNCPVCGAEMRVGTDMTNADRIRAMSDEELAEYLYERGNCQEYCYGICDIQDECDDPPSDEYCIRHIVKWLKKEVEDG